MMDSKSLLRSLIVCVAVIVLSLFMISHTSFGALVAPSYGVYVALLIGVSTSVLTFKMMNWRRAGILALLAFVSLIAGFALSNRQIPLF